jgi:hypothetical protein
VEGVSEDRDHLPTGCRGSKRENEAPAGDDGAFIVLPLVERTRRLSATVAASCKPGEGRPLLSTSRSKVDGEGHKSPGGASSRSTRCRAAEQTGDERARRQRGALGGHGRAQALYELSHNRESFPRPRAACRPHRAAPGDGAAPSPPGALQLLLVQRVLLFGAPAATPRRFRVTAAGRGEGTEGFTGGGCPARAQRSPFTNRSGFTRRIRCTRVGPDAALQTRVGPDVARRWRTTPSASSWKSEWSAGTGSRPCGGERGSRFTSRGASFERETVEWFQAAL